MLDDKVVLVTGGTGSFGNKFVEVVLQRSRPRKLIVFSRDELKQHEMQARFPARVDGSPMRYFLGDIRDRRRLYRAFKGVDVVIHAAALKHVPACEYNPLEAIQTNIIGAANIIDAAIDRGVKQVLAISTDKAVNPINLYGATKLCAEKLFVQANAYSTMAGTRFTCARYGNVLGSRGSVVPVFQAQRKNGTITITDPRMTRFWLTLDQGVDFVLRCLEDMQGGEVYVPKIPSMNIIELAKAIAPECEVKQTGIRPGEKLHESLISPDESGTAYEREDRYMILPSSRMFEYKIPPAYKPLELGFSYTSDKNPRWLSQAELHDLLTT